MKEVLGKWLRVTPDDPFEPKHLSAGSGDPKGAYQPYQLDAAIEVDALRQNLRTLLREKLIRRESD